MIHVLVVDDEPPLVRTLTLNLINRGYHVTSARTGAGALDQVASAPPDLILLDLGLPDVDGTAVLRELRRQRSAIPVIVLSARTDSSDKVEALDAGATDYLTKPFDVSELMARLRAVARRANLSEPDAPIRVGATVVDVNSRTVGLERDDGTIESIHLTPTEWRLLELLVRRPGVLIPTSELQAALRGSSHSDRSYLRIYMQHLRRKLEPEPSGPRHLITEPGLGYRFLPGSR
jgi:two-component system KDP operon response regulator KdpE